MNYFTTFRLLMAFLLTIVLLACTKQEESTTFTRDFETKEHALNLKKKGNRQLYLLNGARIGKLTTDNALELTFSTTGLRFMYRDTMLTMTNFELYTTPTPDGLTYLTAQGFAEYAIDASGELRRKHVSFYVPVFDKDELKEETARIIGGGAGVSPGGTEHTCNGDQGFLLFNCSCCKLVKEGDNYRCDCCEFGFCSHSTTTTTTAKTTGGGLSFNPDPSLFMNFVTNLSK